MPFQTKQPQSMADGLQKLLGDVAQLMAAPDADLQFLQGLQMAITQQIRNGPGLQDPQHMQQMAAQQMGGPGVAPGPGTPGGPGGLPAGAAAAGPSGPSPMGGAMPGLTPTAPDMDEIRRMLQAQGSAQ